MFFIFVVKFYGLTSILQSKNLGRKCIPFGLNGMLIFVMKKIISLFSLFLVLTMMFFCVSCDKGYKLKEDGAEVITIYICDFEDWSNDYFMDAIDRYNDNLSDGVEIVYELLDDSAYTYKVESSRESGKSSSSSAKTLLAK